MKPLSKWQNAVFVFGAVLMVVGAASSIVVRRLLRIQVLSDLLLLLTGVLMIANEGNSFGLEWLNYVNYVQNNWVVTLLLAAILQLYTTFRISKELEKEAKKL